MPSNPTPPSSGSVDSSSSVFTQAEGQVLAHLFAHGRTSAIELAAACGLVPSVLRIESVLQRLYAIDLVCSDDNGWFDLTIETRGVMLLALESSLARGAEGSHHG